MYLNLEEEMALYLKDPCSYCGEKVGIITFLDNINGKNVECVSHGQCEGCGRVVILPTDPIAKFPHQ